MEHIRGRNSVSRVCCWWIVQIIVCGVQMVLLIGGYGGAEAGELDL